MKKRWFKTPYAQQGELQIDRANSVIRNVVMCQTGEAKGHGVSIEQSFIDELVSQANQYQAGLKARFGHPNMSDESLGAYMGTFKNASVRGNQAIADLYLSDAAEVAPERGNLKEWVFRMAENSPAHIMSSIVFTEKSQYFYDSKGKKQDINKVNPPADATIFTEMDRLLGCDLVEEGAATDSLFSKESLSALLNKDKFAVIATEYFDRFLEENPQIQEFVISNPNKVHAFFDKYFMKFSKTQENTVAQTVLNAIGLGHLLSAKPKTDEEDDDGSDNSDEKKPTAEELALAEAKENLRLKELALAKVEKELAELKAEPAGKRETTGGKDVDLEESTDIDAEQLSVYDAALLKKIELRKKGLV